MFFSNASGLTIFLLMLPAVHNLWTIWHAMNHAFPQEKERLLWVLAGIFLPVLGGILYLIFGFKRSKPIR